LEIHRERSRGKAAVLQIKFVLRYHARADGLKLKKHMRIKWSYGVFAILFSIIVAFDFLILFQSWADGVQLHPQLQQHFYFNPPIMIFLWYMALKKYD